MPGTGELAALGTAVCWSFTAIFFAASAQLVGSRTVNRSRLLFALCILAGLHFVHFGAPLPLDAGLERWFWLGLSSLLGFVLGDAALFQAFVLIGPRLGVLMMATVPLQSSILGRVVLGETISARELAGMMLTLGGIAWVMTEGRGGRSEPESAALRRGTLLGLIGAFGQSTNLLTAKFGLVGGFSPVSATVIRVLVGVVVMWSAAAAQRQVLPTIAAWRNRRALAAILAGTVAGPVSGVSLSMMAIQNARLGIATTLMTLPPVLILPIEWALFGRTVSPRAVGGTLVAFAGAATLLLGT
jgi:drug/metabolite transporter (DMT)-like permease